MTPEQRHLQRVKELPCVICYMLSARDDIGELMGGSDAHHILDTSSRSDWLTIPLCKEHHQGGTGFHGLGQRAFERMYRTTEAKLLAWTIKRLMK